MSEPGRLAWAWSIIRTALVRAWTVLRTGVDPAPVEPSPDDQP